MTLAGVEPADVEDSDSPLDPAPCCYALLFQSSIAVFMSFTELLVRNSPSSSNLFCYLIACLIFSLVWFWKRHPGYHLIYLCSPSSIGIFIPTKITILDIVPICFTIKFQIVCNTEKSIRCSISFFKSHKIPFFVFR